MQVVHDPENKLKIENVWAFVSHDDKGNEGLCAIPTNLGMMPMIAADVDRLNSLKEAAQKLKAMTNKKIKLIKFSVREDLETI